MGISTTGFVLTDKKDVWAMMSTIEETLFSLVKKYGSGQPIFQDSTSRFPTIQMSPGGQSCQIMFRVRNEDRMVSVHFNCDCDYSEHGDSKVIWSVNTWGAAEEIVLTICEAMKSYGRVFYCANDATSDDFVEV